MKITIGSNKWQKKQVRKNGRKFCYVYGIYDPAGDLRYIGQTRQTLKSRMSFHHKTAKERPKAKLSPIILGGAIIKMIDAEATWDVSEILWIDHYRREGAALVNVTRGGSDTVYCVQRESKKKRYAKKPVA